MADNRLWAELMACKSPVKCKLMSSIGSTCAYPPPAAPPLMLNTGPNEGSRIATIARLPSRLIASAKPIVTVVLPSPAGVGLMAVIKINLPFLEGNLNAACGLILAL